ncbi:nucleoside diphosphate-linked moiety X motif 8 [Trichomycterus rosablanca]|uniref:nucleoside diphosphate-linked moiety X motif 8 n=1 Tax=Trichomycterus rosablanca TaxID=2290929 RepID=UPI002F35EF16
MFRSPHFLTSACLLGTHRSLLMTFNSHKPNKGRPAYNTLSRLFCLVSRETEKQWKQQHILKPSNTCNKLSSVYYLNDTLPDRVNLRNSNCLLFKKQINNNRRYAHTLTKSLKHNIENQKTYHTSIGQLFKGNPLWTYFKAGWSQHGPLVSQTCGVHKRIPQQVIREDCLSAENKARCQVLMQPNPALYEKNTGKSCAAVLVSLCTVGGEPSFLFTLRSSKLRGRHKGDVSFAGGKQDQSDRNVVETALREAREELGITVSENEVWGVLKPLSDMSGLRIAPVLANLGPLETLTLRPNPSEVEEIFTLTVAHVSNPQNRGYTHFRTGNRYGFTLPVFHNDKYRVWGLTAVALDYTLKLIMPEEQL